MPHRAARGTRSSRPSSATRRGRAPEARASAAPVPRPGLAVAAGAVDATSRAARSASASSIASWAAGSSPGSVVLLGGEPGIGKSTLLLQAAAGVAASGGATRPVRDGRGVGGPGPAAGRPARAARRRRGATRSASWPRPASGGSSDLRPRDRPGCSSSTPSRPSPSEELDGPPGSVGQVREVDAAADGAREGRGRAGHPRRARDEGRHARRAQDARAPRRRRAVARGRPDRRRCASCGRRRTATGRPRRSACSRWGSAGLAEVADPARAFLADHDAPAPGSVVAPILEGSRPLLVEVQALVAPTGAPSPRRTASGVDPNRLALLVAVLGRRAGIGLSAHDVYANLAGGLAVSEPGLDLPLALALASSLRDRPVEPGTVAIGEVGLLGELRAGRRPRPPPARGRSARVHAGARPRAPPRPRPAGDPGLRLVVVGTLARRGRAARSAGRRRERRPADPDSGHPPTPVRAC